MLPVSRSARDGTDASGFGNERVERWLQFSKTARILANVGSNETRP